MKSYVKIKDDNGMKGLALEMKKLRAEIHVGIPAYPKEIVIRANVNEYGSEIIPERSFIRATFDEEERKVNRMAQNGLMDVLAGRRKAKAVLNEIGEYLVEAVKDKIENMSPENAPSTEKQKGTNKPLIDTGELLDSITYKVVY